jgi:hypothetical protein
VLAYLTRTFLGRHCSVFTPGLTLVTCVHVVEVRDVLAGRMAPGIHPPDGLQRLLDSPSPSGRLVHVSSVDGSYPESERSNPGLESPPWRLELPERRLPFGDPVDDHEDDSSLGRGL